MIFLKCLDPLSFLILWINLLKKSSAINSNSMWCLTTSFIKASLVDSSLNPLWMLESLLSISFAWDGLKTSLQALSLLISSNFSSILIIIFYLSYLGKQGLIFMLSNFSPIILLKERLIMFGTISVCHLLISILEWVKDWLSLLFFLSFIFYFSFIF